MKLTFNYSRPVNLIHSFMSCFLKGEIKKSSPVIKSCLEIKYEILLLTIVDTQFI